MNEFEENTYDFLDNNQQVDFLLEFEFIIKPYVLEGYEFKKFFRFCIIISRYLIPFIMLSNIHELKKKLQSVACISL